MSRCSTRSARWPSCTRPRWLAGSPTARSRSSAAAVTCASTRRRGSSASSESSGSGREPARSSARSSPTRWSSAAQVAWPERRWLLRQARLDRADELGGLRFGQRPEPAQHLAVAPDQELLEVPLNVAGLAVGVGDLGQLRIQGMLSLPVDDDLGEQRERDPVVHRAELADLLRRAGLLLAELVAREPGHGEPALGELVVEPLQALVLRCQPALGCHIDDEYRRAGEIAEGGWISAQSLKSNVLHGHVGTPGVMLMGTSDNSVRDTIMPGPCAAWPIGQLPERGRRSDDSTPASQPRTSPRVRSGRSAWPMCEQPGSTPNCDPGMASCAWATVAGVTSSNSPQNSSVGASIEPSSAVTSESFSGPITWNSLGPFIVWYTSGFAARPAKQRSSQSG